MTIIASDFSWDLKPAALAAVSSEALSIPSTFLRRINTNQALMESKMTNPVKRKILKEQGVAWNQSLLLPLKYFAINTSAGFKQVKWQHLDYLQAEGQ